MRKLFKRLATLGTSLALGALAFAQTADVDPTPIVDRVTANLTAIAGAGVGILGLSIGLTAAFKFAKRFLKG